MSVKNEKKNLTLKECMELQQSFSDLFFKEENLSSEEKEEKMRSFALALHAEVSSLVSAVNYKEHRFDKHDPDYGQILFKAVDVIRYVFAILNLWKITPEELEHAFKSKDLFLHLRHQMNQESIDDNRPVVLFDMDDVITQLRKGFSEWVTKTHKINLPKDSTEYYYTSPLVDKDLSPSIVFQNFVAEGGFDNLAPNLETIQVMRQLRDAGFKIHIITARPSDHLITRYGTYEWLVKHDVPIDAVSFNSEKFKWLSGKDFFLDGKVVCAVDDSSKHVTDYSKHGIVVLVPETSYNQDIKGQNNVIFYNNPNRILEEVLELSKTGE